MLGEKAVRREIKVCFPGPGTAEHLTTIQHAHEKGTRCAESGMDKFTLARLMGHSSPRVAERYYVHVTEPHVMTGFERFLNWSVRSASGLVLGCAARDATLLLDGRIQRFDEMAARAGSHYTDRTLGPGIKAFVGSERLRYRSISACCTSPKPICFY